MTEPPRRKPGRPASGKDPNPTRSVRIGSVWDAALRVARKRGESLSGIITRTLECYVAQHSAEIPSRNKGEISVGKPPPAR